MDKRSTDQISTYFFHEGTTIEAYTYMGAHPDRQDGAAGYVFRVWAPNARAVSVVGDFNSWDRSSHPMEKITQGIWETFIPGLKQYDLYKFAVEGPDGTVHLKADPYAFHCETRPGTSSKLYDISGYQWNDGDWQKAAREHPAYAGPLNIYEVHLGSWRKRPNGDFIDYRDMADQLSDMSRRWALTILSCSPLPSTPWTPPGATSAPGTTPPPPATGSPTTSCTLWTRCTRRAWA